MAKTYTAVPTVTAGDVYTASAYNTYTSTNVSNLIVPPIVTATRTTNQSFTSGSPAKIDFTGTDLIDTDDMHNPASNSTRVTAATAGVYMLSCFANFAANVTGRRLISLFKNGSSLTPNIQSEMAQSSSGDISLHLVSVIALSVSDYVEIEGFQTSGVAINLTAAQLSLVWIGRTS